MQDTIELKQQIKNTIIEVLEDDNEFLRNLLSDFMEDIALGKAIAEGDKGDFIDENVIIAQLTKEI